MKKLLVLAILSCGVNIFINGCATLQDSRTNPSDSTAISGEWKLLEFLSSYENIDKKIKVAVCYAKGDDSAQCDKTLDSWRESCERGEEKYCIAIFAIYSQSHYDECSKIGNPLPKHCGNSKIDKYLTLLKQNCDNGMANSCYAVGDFYNGLYLEIRSKEEYYIAPQMLDNALIHFQKSCDLGMAISCIYIAHIYESEHFQDTKQVKIYTDKARVIADKDCKAGVKMACEFQMMLID